MFENNMADRIIVYHLTERAFIPASASCDPLNVNEWFNTFFIAT